MGKLCEPRLSLLQGRGKLGELAHCRWLVDGRSCVGDAKHANHMAGACRLRRPYSR